MSGRHGSEIDWRCDAHRARVAPSERESGTRRSCFRAVDAIFIAIQTIVATRTSVLHTHPDRASAAPGSVRHPVPEASMTRIRSILLLTAVLAIACHQNQPKSAPTPVAPPPAPAGRGNPAPAPPPAPGDSAAPAGGGGRGGGRGGASQAPQPYGQVIRGAGICDTRSGLFKTHQIGDSLFYEIPRSELNRDMLLTTEIEKTAQGMGYGGQMIGDAPGALGAPGQSGPAARCRGRAVASDTTNPGAHRGRGRQLRADHRRLPGRRVRPGFGGGDQRDTAVQESARPRSASPAGIVGRSTRTGPSSAAWRRTRRTSRCAPT